jgi:lipopolysaccharide export system protein LptC
LGKNRKRKQRVGAVLKATAAILLVAAAVGVWWFYRTPPKQQGIQEFFTDDDGATWFADDGTKIAPFDHNGKPAVLAKVYETARGKQFVAYLMKFTDKAHDDAVYSQKTQQVRPGPAAAKGSADNILLVKKPHDKEWVPANDPKAREIQTIKSPDGSADYTTVRPE